MKNKSISRRLAVQIVGLLLSFSMILLIANSLLLKPLYYNSVKNNMISGIDELETIDFADDSTGLTVGILNINPIHGYDITIEYDGNIIYSSSMEIGIKGSGDFYKENHDFEPKNNNPRSDFKDKNKPLFPVELIENWMLYENDVEIGTFNTDRDHNGMFVARKIMDNGITIYLTQGIEPILNSVRQANILLLIVTAMFMFVAIIVVLVISKKFTKPITMMQNHVGKLSELEFDERLTITTGDELENLSEDINKLARKLEEALFTLNEQNKQLQRDVVSQRKFISNASHELRTPLSLIKGYAEEIVQGYIKNREQEHTYVGYIVEESRKMKRLLNETLELSRLESGRMSLQCKTEDVKLAIESFVDKYSGFIEDHNLKLELSLEYGIGYFDPIRFEQVMANYIGNAGKYCDFKKIVKIKLEEKQNSYRIIVSNSGQAISKDIIDFIWDGFYKADEVRTTKEGSYGLGLSIVKAIQNLTNQPYGYYSEDGFVSFWFEVSKK